MTPVGGQALAELLSEQFGRWARQRGASAPSVQAAADAGHALGLADAQSQVCWQAPADRLDLRALLASGLACTGAQARSGSFAPVPMVVDEHLRVYLWHRFVQQQQLARALHARHAALPPAEGEAAALQRLRTLFGDSAVLADREQWRACAMALRQRLVVISGGPGTGKTTTVVRLLAALLAQAPQAHIALAAPTGKAAARMSEAMLQRGGELTDAERAALPTQASTVHRLLGLRPDGTARHHRSNPLALDVLVVDEASMLDLNLAHQLLDALAPQSRLVLLGDKDQLASVQAGSVFADLSHTRALDAPTHHWLQRLGLAADLPAPLEAPPEAPPPLANQVAWLTFSRRFSAQSGIGQLAAWVRDGPHRALPAAWGASQADGPNRWADVQWLATEPPALEPTQGQTPALHPDAWKAAQQGYAPFRAAAQAWIDTTHPDAALQALALAYAAYNQFRVLCAHRNGPHSVAAFNQALDTVAWQEHLGARGPQGQRWVLGQPLLVTANDTQREVFNGDIGLLGRLPAAGPQASTWALWLPDARSGGRAAWRAVPQHRLPALQSAWALTVHQSQGSEFETVLLQLPEPGPDGAPSPVLSREWLYTGVTRARSRLLIAGPAQSLLDAAVSPLARASGLASEMGLLQAQKVSVEIQNHDPVD